MLICHWIIWTHLQQNVSELCIENGNKTKTKCLKKERGKESVINVYSTDNSPPICFYFSYNHENFLKKAKSIYVFLIFHLFFFSQWQQQSHLFNITFFNVLNKNYLNIQYIFLLTPLVIKQLMFKCELFNSTLNDIITGVNIQVKVQIQVQIIKVIAAIKSSTIIWYITGQGTSQIWRWQYCTIYN